MRPYRRNLASTQSGFSLLELVVVVAVLAILAAIAIPAFQDASNNAKIATAKTNISLVVKECIVLQASGNANPTISDVASARSNNPYGDALGLGFGSEDGFTYDTDLNSQRTLRPSDSCMSIAAKSATFAIKAALLRASCLTLQFLSIQLLVRWRKIVKLIVLWPTTKENPVIRIFPLDHSGSIRALAD